MSPSDRKTKPTRRKRPFLGSLLLAIGLVIPLYNWRWIFNAILGPTEMSERQVAQIKDPQELPSAWISFPGNKLIETRLGQLETQTGKPISRYVLVSLPTALPPWEFRWLVAEVPWKHKDVQLTGCLTTWSTPLRRKALDEIRLKFPHFKFLPFQMNATVDYRGQCWAMLAIAGLIIVIGAWALFGFAAPGGKAPKGRAAAGSVPTWLEDLGGGSPVPQDGAAHPSHVFEARQVNALSSDRLYRLYVEDARCYMIRIGGQRVSPEVTKMFGTPSGLFGGLVGGLIGGVIAVLASRGNRSVVEIAKMDVQHPNDLLASHEHNFCFTACACWNQPSTRHRDWLPMEGT